MGYALTATFLVLTFSLLPRELPQKFQVSASGFGLHYEPTWFASYFMVASLLESQSYATILYRHSYFYQRRFTCLGLIGHNGCISCRHATCLRILLLIAGVEPNPGPVNLQGTSKSVLESMLKILHADDDTYSPPQGTKAELIEKLNEITGNNANIIQLVYQQAQVPAVSAPAPAPAAPPPPDSYAGSRTAKLPEFYEKDTRVWFEQIEQILSQSSDTTKKSSLLIALPTDVLLHSGAQATDSFETIKATIISYFDDSTDQNLRKLLREQQLGDRKPSSVLRSLQRLAPNHEGLVRMRFIEIMPENTRVTLAACMDDLTLEKVAAIADRLVNQTATPRPISNIDCPNTLENQIAELTKVVNALQANQRGRSRDRAPSGGSNFRRDRSRSFKTDGKFCWYHFRYGSNARSCNSPCSWDPNRSRPAQHSGNASAPPPQRQPAE